MISLKKVDKKYKLNSEEIIALNKINIDFECGKFYAIAGHSGCGKSTLLHLIGLLDQVTSGCIKIDNNIIDNNTGEKEKELIRKKYIGYVFQDFFLNNELTALENVMIPMYLNNTIKKKERVEKAKKILENFGLKNRINHYPNELSGGEQQRVAIARAIANNPKIILADEPTGNLDKKNEKIILEILKKLAIKNCYVIVATHSDLIKSYADIVINIEEGKIIK